MSIEELLQTVIGIVAQTLFQSPIIQEERRALFEILSDAQLQMAIKAIMQKTSYELPHGLTLAGQKEMIESHHYANMKLYI